ncbi:MAG: radical SAM protein [Candidatus Aenigmarchaeota archaeon]
MSHDLRILQPYRPDGIFNHKVKLESYIGSCSFGCKYCFTRNYNNDQKTSPHKIFAEYGREEFSRILGEELDRTRKIVDMCSTTDPYLPEEKEYEITRTSLEVLARKGNHVMINTKGSLILRDLDILKEMLPRVLVSVTITHPDDGYSMVLEPYPPSSSERIELLKELASKGFKTKLNYDPVIKGYNDNPKLIRALISKIGEENLSMIDISVLKTSEKTFRSISEADRELGKSLEEFYLKGGETGKRYRTLNAENVIDLLFPLRDVCLDFDIPVSFYRDIETAESRDGYHLLIGD